MAGFTNSDLRKAKTGKNDEFYTQYDDIEKEIGLILDYNPRFFRGKTVLLPCDDPEWSNFTRYFMDNFEKFGLARLISTSYSRDGGQGRILDISADNYSNKLSWQSLKGDGDFRSEEVTNYLSQADVVITNPPFSLFREILAWVLKADKLFSLVGNMNAITYRVVFPLIKDNLLWLGASITSGDREFRVPDDYPLKAAGFRVDKNGEKYIRVKGVRWFTNIPQAKRLEFLPLKTMAENLAQNKRIFGTDCYRKYDGYDVLEVSSASAIPSDYNGIMGVPISFLDKYCPNQFTILGIANCSHYYGYECYAKIDGRNIYHRIILERLGNN